MIHENMKMLYTVSMAHSPRNLKQINVLYSQGLYQLSMCHSTSEFLTKVFLTSDKQSYFVLVYVEFVANSKNVKYGLVTF